MTVDANRAPAAGSFQIILGSGWSRNIGRAGNEASPLNGPSGLGCAAIAGRPPQLPCNHAAKSAACGERQLSPDAPRRHDVGGEPLPFSVASPQELL